MIRKAHFILFVLFLFHNNLSSAKSRSLIGYHKIAEEYNMNIYPIDFGHTILFDWDLEQTNGVIYLTNEIEHLEKFDDRTYLCPPELEHAEIIREFGVTRDEIPIYYLVIDTLIEQAEITSFIKELGGDELSIIVRFVGDKNSYVQVKYLLNALERENNIVECFFGARRWMSVFTNSLDQLMVSGKILDTEELYDLISSCYRGDNVNLFGLDGCFSYYRVEVKRQIEYVKILENASKEDSTNTRIIDNYLKEEKKLRLALEFGDYTAVKKGSIFIRNQLYTSQGFMLEIMSVITKAMVEEREKYTELNWGKPYERCLENQNEMDFLQEIIPDDISITMIEPFIEEIEIIEVERD